MFPCFIVLHRSILLPVLTLNLLTVLTILGIIINTDFRFWENKKYEISSLRKSENARGNFAIWELVKFLIRATERELFLLSRNEWNIFRQNGNKQEGKSIRLSHYYFEI